MRLVPKYVSERKVRRELSRDGTYSVALSGMDRAWNPTPDNELQRLTTGTPISGPFKVTYQINDGGNVSARLQRL